MYKIFLIFFIFLIGPLKAEQFTSIENFTFELPKGYMILNKNNLYDIYNTSNHDPILKKQMSLFKQRLQKQNVEILYNFNQSRFNNISIMVFDDYYKVNQKKVLKQCKKILKEMLKLKRVLEQLQMLELYFFGFQEWLQLK